MLFSECSGWWCSQLEMPFYVDMDPLLGRGRTLGEQLLCTYFEQYEMRKIGEHLKNKKCESSNHLYLIFWSRLKHTYTIAHYQW